MLLKYLLKCRHLIKNSTEIKAELNRQLLSIQVNVFCIFSIIVLGLIDYNFGQKSIAYFNFITAIIYFLVFLLFTYGYAYLPRLLLFITTYVALIIVSCFVGPEAGTSFVWFPLLCAIFFIF